MIRGVHTMFYSSEPEALRVFLRDKLGFKGHDVGGGWLVFDLPEADMGCHPAEDKEGGQSGTHNISFYCDDIEKTVADLKKRGVEFSKPNTACAVRRASASASSGFSLRSTTTQTSTYWRCALCTCRSAAAGRCARSRSWIRIRSGSPSTKSR